MRFSLRNLLLFLVVSATCRSELLWESRKIEAVAEKNQSQVTAGFRFKNTGPRPVTIVDVHTGCGCTTAELQKRIYQPGEGGEITTIFTVGDMKGVQLKSLTVTTEDSADKVIPLTLQVTIPEGITYDPRVFVWRMGDQVTDKEVGIRIGGPARIATVEVTSVTPLDSAVVAVQPADGSGRFRVLIRPRSTLKVQQVTVSGVATTVDGSRESFSIYALVR